MLATGAGSEMRQAMGVAVFSGMIGVTVFGLLLTPLFYVGIRRMVEKVYLEKPGLHVPHRQCGDAR